VRSRGDFDARDVCTPFGGGGHHRQAGAELPVGVVEATQRVVDRARQLIKEAS
jgi:nanoRNase/pAp phosphatase (c-di-AMP/oligoRNAs hydrolase)